MIAKSSGGRARKTIIAASIALAFGLASAPRSFAGCGGYCEAPAGVGEICHHAVKVPGLKGHNREAEFQKCKEDPAGYLQLEELTDDAEMNVE